MTASETGAGEERSLSELALDLFVYLPAGLLATALEDMDQVAEKGRERVDQQLRNAHVVGRFAVDFGLQRLKQQAETLRAEPAERSRGGSRAESRRSQAPDEPQRRTASRPRPRPRSVVEGGRSGRDPEVDRAIPDYDALSASQVVRRLDGLDVHELSAVVRHERASRGRRTILQRAAQLIEAAPSAPPGAPANP